MSVLGGLESKCLTALEAQDDGTFELPAEANYIPLPKLLQEEPVPKKCKVYSLSRSLAKTIGIVPALVLKFLAYKVYSVRHQRDGRLWYYATYREIAKQYPFLHPSTIDRAIKKLESEGLLEIGNYNRRKKDKTRWFSVSQQTRDLSDANIIYFDPRDAGVVGIKAAIVFYHLKYSFKNSPEVLKDGIWLKVWPSDLAAFQPLTPLEAQNALKELVLWGYLVRDKTLPNSCYYSLSSLDDDFGYSILKQTPMKMRQNSHGNEADPHENEATLPIVFH